MIQGISLALQCTKEQVLSYSAEYRDGDTRPHIVYTKTADEKYHVTFKRIYGMYEDKINESYR